MSLVILIHEQITGRQTRPNIAIYMCLPSVFACVARRRESASNHSRAPRARVSSARASRAVGIPSHRSSPRWCCLRFTFLAFLISACASSTVGLRLRHSPSQTTTPVTRACLALACRRRAPPAPSTFPLVARRHESVVCVFRFFRFSSRRAPPRARVSSARTSRAFDVPSRRSLPRRRCLRFMFLVFLISACASSAVGLRSRHSSSRRRSK